MSEKGLVHDEVVVEVLKEISLGLEAKTTVRPLGMRYKSHPTYSKSLRATLNSLLKRNTFGKGKMKRTAYARSLTKLFSNFVTL